MQESKEAANDDEEEGEGTEIDFAIPVDPQNLQHNPQMQVWHGIAISRMDDNHIGRVCRGPVSTLASPTCGYVLCLHA